MTSSIFPPPLRYRFRRPCTCARVTGARHLVVRGHGRTCRPCTTSRTGRPSTSCCCSTSPVSWSASSPRSTAAATAARLRRLLRGVGPAARTPAALLPPRRQLGRADDLRDPGLRLRTPRHEPGGLRAGRRLGAGRTRRSSSRWPCWPSGCCGRPSGGSRAASPRWGRSRRRLPRAPSDVTADATRWCGRRAPRWSCCSSGRS